MAEFRELLVNQSVNLGGQLAGLFLRSRSRPAPAPTVEFERPALAEAEAMLARHRDTTETERAASTAERPIPATLFDDIVGHDETKRLLLAALHARKPVHILLIGPPATGKSRFLEAIATLPRSRYAVGGATSSSGLIDFLLEKPETRILVIDELDKAEESELYALYSLMESGKVSRLQHGKTEEIERRVWVFAAANSTEGLPPALASRFVRLDLQPYSQAQTERITQSVLVRGEGISPARAKVIARATAARSRDPRDGVQVGRLTGEAAPLEPTVSTVTRTPAPSKASKKRLS